MKNTVKLSLIVSALLLNMALFSQSESYQVKNTREFALTENPIGNIWAYADDENLIIDLNENFATGDNEVSYQLIVNTNPDIAIATITDINLEIEFVTHGQSTIILSATYEETTIYDTIVVGVLPVIEGGFEVVDFEGLELEEDSFWNGSDETGYFNSGMAIFENSYNSDWGSWSGWAYSNVNDTETAGFSNQYAAYTGQGLDPLTSGGANYGVAYPYSESVIIFADDGNYNVKGIYITNSTYAYLTIKYGDDFTTKFGGESGNDEDWFLLTITGKYQGAETGTIDYYLADYRFEDNDEDYIIETWQYVELSELGQVDTLLFSLSSSDNGDWGMNTPGYFCVDNLLFTYEEAVDIAENIAENILVYPNPASSYIMVETQSETSVNIYSVEGRLVLSQIVNNTEMLDVSSFKSGIYTMSIETSIGRTIKKLIIE
ncbi:MAG: DUF4465 domain-containing protein [Bacteroidales bacterium]|nr:DUF4465 domain-containing protein [Bacteroidales bacterium]